jgi:hypothetical protein
VEVIEVQLHPPTDGPTFCVAEKTGIAYLSEYVVPRLSAWQARATLTFAVIAAAHRATQGHVDWPATDIWRLARALRDRAPGLYAVLITLLEHVEQPGPTV